MKIPLEMLFTFLGRKILEHRIPAKHSSLNVVKLEVGLMLKAVAAVSANAQLCPSTHPSIISTESGRFMTSNLKSLQKHPAFTSLILGGK